ncbi:RCC1 domain-containing protein [Brevibacillus laterosporus]|uniref:RCC1 domain-containing protein n=1 Tax=Brevibacillus laterosporus TaxID=1465 RepID=UPI000CE53CEB|nr:hypothetical protein [Brevibacillus laterosporus]MED1666039.1 hypothetical protein [Brevibacillus laterosporus]MED1667820.1 hypothetical protein [Brevibacillus laterosporus]MED1719609.1 hypothetical protein [Brevibacillus laterosporus]PPA89980.1 hypothetical protein C4A76_00435 [Brevibacillus laterosporus]
MPRGAHTVYVVEGSNLPMVLGSNYYGQLAHGSNLGKSDGYRFPSEVGNPILMNTVKVASGNQHTLFLTAEGKLYSAGLNNYGQLGVLDNYQTNNYNYNLKFVMDDVVEISAGAYTSFAIKTNGDLYGFGYNGLNQLGVKSGSAYKPMMLMRGVKGASTGNGFSLVIKGNGDLYGCGENDAGQLALSSPSNVPTWTLIATDVKQAFASYNNSYIVKEDGKAYACGDNYYGQMGNTNGVGSKMKFTEFVYVTDSVKSIFALENTAYFQKNDLKLWGCGDSQYGQLGQGRTNNSYSSLVEVGTATLVGGGSNHLLISPTANRFVYGAGKSSAGALGTNSQINSNLKPIQNSKVNRLLNNVTQIIILSEINMMNQIKKKPFKLTAKAVHDDGLQMQYKILVNGIQKYPDTGWTSLKNNPLDLEETFPASYFNAGENIVTLAIRDSEGYTIIHPEYVTLVNKAPQIVNPQLSDTEVHEKDVTFNATLIDEDEDKVRYKVFLNEEQYYPASGYTPLVNAPANVSIRFSNNELLIGKNTIKIDVVDEVGGASTYTTEITKINNPPMITGTIKGSFLSAKITDEDGDRIRYKMTLNNKQVIPVNGYTKLMNTPVVLNQSFHRTLINVGAENVLKIEAMDEVGGTFSKDIKFTGVYSGLLFCDAEETLYTTEIGELLKYLDFGDVISGQTTPAERVWVKNTLGFPVNDITIIVDQGDFDGVNTRVEISRFDSPFDGKDSLAFSGLTNHDEKIDFYVRIVTKKKSNSSGKFNITVKAEPVIE